MSSSVPRATRSKVTSWCFDLVHPESLGRGLDALLNVVASLRLTVALLAMAIFIVLAGTMAQVNQGIWQVTEEYFRTSVAWIDLQIFFPRHWFPDLPDVPGRFPFPGGWLIGGALAVNLLAAHLVRYPIRARGARRVGGVIVSLVGILMTWMVIVGGSTDHGVADVIPLHAATVWVTIKAGLSALWLAAIFALVMLDTKRKAERLGLMLLVLGLGAGVLWLFYRGGQGLINDSSLRILWQLTKGGLAALVLLAGCAMLFGKRCGIVLMHAGVGLLMVGELIVGLQAVEGHMRIEEGQSVNFVEHSRAWELAIVDPSDPNHDDVLVIPADRLRGGGTIQHQLLPFDVSVVEFFTNSELRKVEGDEDNLATAGTGLTMMAQERAPVSGTEREVDLPSSYVTFTHQGSGQSLGTYLLSLQQSYQGVVERVPLEGKTYDVSLRYKRTYKPYSIGLIDFRYDKYLGTNKAKNFSSDVRLIDPARGVDRHVKIWMNNPLRYAGETFYQSGYDANPETRAEITVLQVVSNWGWMVPYVSCMLVGTGMLAHFMLVLLRFLKRRSERSVDVARVRGHRKAALPWGRRWAVPLLVAGACAFLLGTTVIPPKVTDGQMGWYEFGTLPVAYEGRVKPFDTLARNSLSIISHKQTFKDGQGQTQPAVRWLLDVITRSDAAPNHRVFRIDNLEVLDILGLDRRKGFRYAIDEFRDNLDEFLAQAELARSRPKEELTIVQRKILELNNRWRFYRVLEESFHPATIRKGHEKEDVFTALQRAEALAAYQPPLAVPGDGSTKEPWISFTEAWALDHGKALLGHPRNAATHACSAILDAYRDGDTERFNQAVAGYQLALTERPPELYNAVKTRFEALFNHSHLFLTAAFLYVVAFVLAALAWLKWSGPLNRAAFWLIVITLTVHTVALVSRMYISGRPPVTNLYSSAVFIGWGCVVFGVAFETIYRMGIGNMVSAVSGFATLLIAHFLARSGDTFVVLQAVLDTQFWLATHVTCITLGYSATFIAGGLGILFIVRGVLTPSLSAAVAKDLSRMIYGTVCFAIFFSFVGTVLGGLWADDSWGRFWGWDPKENGALIIVLWNALVLHARWSGMVRDRGLAVLAVAGNICTAWSWFGTNELGVGLHSYGFTEGVLPALLFFGLSQLAVMALGLLPTGMWWSQIRSPQYPDGATRAVGTG